MTSTAPVHTRATGRLESRLAPEYTHLPFGGGPMKVRKAVIPAAGLGTRFLPATKAQPKEMLPVVDKPAIQYVVEEAVRAALTDILIITGRGKRSIEDHFDRSVELESFLEARGKFDDLILGTTPLLQEMLRIHERYGRSVIAVQEVARDEIGMYGSVEPEFVQERLARVVSIVEKPAPDDAPSNLAVIGRYVLTPEIFDS